MEVSKIAAHIRFSKDIGGSWKSLELALFSSHCLHQVESARQTCSFGRTTYLCPAP